MLDLGKRRAEHFVIETAYGGFEPHTQERLDEIFEQYPDLKNVYQKHVALRRCLKSVEPPDHQLSSERLREAILNSSQPKKKRNRVSIDWTLWSALGVVGCAGLLVAIRSLGHLDGVIDANRANDSTHTAQILSFNSENGLGSVQMVGENIQPSTQANSESILFASWDESPFRAFRLVVPDFPIINRKSIEVLVQSAETSLKNSYGNRSQVVSELARQNYAIASRSGFTLHKAARLISLEAVLHAPPINGRKKNLTDSRISTPNKLHEVKSGQSAIVDIQPNSTNLTGLPRAREVSNSQDIPLGS